MMLAKGRAFTWPTLMALTTIFSSYEIFKN